MATLEQTASKPETKIRRVTTCVCGREYDLQKRLEAIRNLPQPNSAGIYCSDHCWAYETSLLETS